MLRKLHLMEDKILHRSLNSSYKTKQSQSSQRRTHKLPCFNVQFQPQSPRTNQNLRMSTESCEPLVQGRSNQKMLTASAVFGRKNKITKIKTKQVKKIKSDIKYNFIDIPSNLLINNKQSDQIAKSLLTKYKNGLRGSHKRQRHPSWFPPGGKNPGAESVIAKVNRIILSMEARENNKLSKLCQFDHKQSTIQRKRVRLMTSHRRSLTESSYDRSRKKHCPDDSLAISATKFAPIQTN